MSVHHFEADIAQEVGVNAAIVAYNILYWCKHKAANEKDIYDGTPWVYNSTKAWSDIIPYLSEKQIRTALKKLEDAKIIASGNHSPSAYDQTKWYTYLRHNWAGSEEGKSNCPNGQMEMTERANLNCPQGQMSFAPEGKSYKEPNKPIENLFRLPPAGAEAFERLRLACGNDHEKSEVLRLQSCLMDANEAMIFVTGPAMLDRFRASLSRPLKVSNLCLAVQGQHTEESIDPQMNLLAGGKS